MNFNWSSKNLIFIQRKKSWKAILDEIYFKWFEIKLIKRYLGGELGHHGGGIPLFGFFEPLKMDLVLDAVFMCEKSISS